MAPSLLLKPLTPDAPQLSQTLTTLTTLVNEAFASSESQWWRNPSDYPPYFKHGDLEKRIAKLHSEQSGVVLVAYDQDNGQMIVGTITIAKIEVDTWEKRVQYGLADPILHKRPDVLMTKTDEREPAVMIKTFAVATHAQQSGFGSHILRAAEEVAVKQFGARYALLEVMSLQVTLAQFYCRRGYRDMGIRKLCRVERDPEFRTLFALPDKAIEQVSIILLNKDLNPPNPQVKEQYIDRNMLPRPLAYLTDKQGRPFIIRPAIMRDSLAIAAVSSFAYRGKPLQLTDPNGEVASGWTGEHQYVGKEFPRIRVGGVEDYVIKAQTQPLTLTLFVAVRQFTADQTVINRRGVIVEDGILVGLVKLEQPGYDAPWYFNFSSDAPKSCELGLFAVDPDEQSSGVGKSLFSCAEAHASNIYRCDSCFLRVSSFRTDLLPAYNRLGYEHAGRAVAPFSSF